MRLGIADLTGIRAKLHRAEEHRCTLEAEIIRWFAEKHANRSLFNIRRDGSWYCVITEPLPKFDIRFAIIAGDIFHNLRSALDHLVYQLVLRDGNKPTRWNEFPIYDSEPRFLDNVKFRKRNPERGPLYGIIVDGDAWTIIEAAQPYKGRDRGLVVLGSRIGIIGKLSNVDKHRTLYVQMAWVHDTAIRDAIGWNPSVSPLEEKINSALISFEKPTEIVRYRFADNTDPNMHVKGRLALTPSFGESPEEGAIQLALGAFRDLIDRVRILLDSVNKLPRVIDV